MLQFLERLSLKRLFILAILLRLVLMPFFFHPDIKTYNFQSSFLKQGVGNIYDYLIENKDGLSLKEEFVYFPLTYFFLGSYQILISPLLGSEFFTWLSDASQQFPEQVSVFRYLFLLKLPYLILDLAIAFLLASLFIDLEQKRKAFILWLFNPFSIILIYVYSNIDIIPVLFTVASLLLAKKQKPILSSLLLGLGAGFKTYPLLFLPFLILLGKDTKQKILITLTCLFTFGIIILPFLTSINFRQATLFSGLTTRIFSVNLSLGFGETLMLPVIILAVLFFFALKDGFLKAENIWKYYLSLLLIIFSFIHFHIQWLLWLLPFAIILFIKEKALTILTILLITSAFLIPLFYDDKAMTFGTLRTISSLYNSFPTPFTLIQEFYDPYQLISILHSVLAGGSLILIWQMLKKEEL